MLIEIPDPEVILSVIIAFLVGLGGLFAYFKLRPMIKTNETTNTSQAERLEYYERQLIDMKIRLDSLEIQGVEEKPVDQNLELKQFLEKLAKNESKGKTIEPVVKSEIVPERPQNITRMPNLDHNNATDYVLQLITNKAMTSRDIQITLKRSREHTSRLMKKLFEDGYVQRNTESKPYSYSISEKGKERIGVVESDPIVV
ncbi:MAG: MarR family transcriptional regulator [Nitrosopumilus sp.]|nr:MarR family transcriptional regulator [Nitrosopumilus sp.]MDH3824259.1 MarR family transcriptional regulator [Nitrosopumilus sp.]